MDDAVYDVAGLSEADLALLEKIERDLGLLADVSRADALLYRRIEQDEAVVVAHAKPHSVPPIYNDSLEGERATPQEKPALFKSWALGGYFRGSQGLIEQGAPIVQEVYPISGNAGSVIGGVSIEKSLIEHERHNRRTRAFRGAVRQFQETVLRGELVGAEELSPFGEHDGILVVGQDKRVKYASGLANNLYRRLGHLGILPGKRLSTLATHDEKLVDRVMEEGRCLEEEVREGRMVWIKKGIPLFACDYGLLGWRRFVNPHHVESKLAGVLLTVHDATEARWKEREWRIQSTMMQEIHHRVKNNLQTIISLLRLQTRRLDTEDGRRVLQDAINRVLSVAIIHEFLSQPESKVINIREVSRLILDQTAQSVVNPHKQIHFALHGPSVRLPAQQATACSLIINELLQNALEHGFDRRSGGTISITLRDEGNRVAIEICDDGGGLPSDFELSEHGSLGLRIVQTLAEDDLKGEFTLRNEDGVSAIVSFPKPIPGGE